MKLGMEDEMNTVLKMVLVLSLSTFVMFFLAFSTNDNIVFAEVETGVNAG